MTENPFFLFGCPHTDQYHIGTGSINGTVNQFIFLRFIFKTIRRRHRPHHDFASHRGIDTFHGLLCHTFHRTQKKYPAIRIILMILIESRKETATRNGFRYSFLQQTRAQIQDFTVANHPLRLLIKVIKLTVMLEFDQMIKIRSDQYPAF